MNIVLLFFILGVFSSNPRNSPNGSKNINKNQNTQKPSHGKKPVNNNPSPGDSHTNNVSNTTETNKEQNNQTDTVEVKVDNFPSNNNSSEVKVDELSRNNNDLVNDDPLAEKNKEHISSRHSPEKKNEIPVREYDYTDKNNDIDLSKNNEKKDPHLSENIDNNNSKKKDQKELSGGTDQTHGGQSFPSKEETDIKSKKKKDLPLFSQKEIAAASLIALAVMIGSYAHKKVMENKSKKKKDEEEKGQEINDQKKAQEINLNVNKEYKIGDKAIGVGSEDDKKNDLEKDEIEKKNQNANVNTSVELLSNKNAREIYDNIMSNRNKRREAKNFVNYLLSDNIRLVNDFIKNQKIPFVLNDTKKIDLFDEENKENTIKAIDHINSNKDEFKQVFEDFKKNQHNMESIYSSVDFKDFNTGSSNTGVSSQNINEISLLKDFHGAVLSQNINEISLLKESNPRSIGKHFTQSYMKFPLIKHIDINELKNLKQSAHYYA